MCGWNIVRSLLCAVCVMIAVADSAYAYIEPGSLSIMLQVVMVIIAGGILSLKSTWRFFKRVIDKLKWR